MNVPGGSESGTAGAPVAKQAGQKKPEQTPPPPPIRPLFDAWLDGVNRRPNPSSLRQSVMNTGVRPAGTATTGIGAPSLTFLPNRCSFQLMPATAVKPVPQSRKGGWLPSKMHALNCAVAA